MAWPWWCVFLSGVAPDSHPVWPAGIARVRVWWRFLSMHSWAPRGSPSAGVRCVRFLCYPYCFPIIFLFFFLFPEAVIMLHHVGSKRVSTDWKTWVILQGTAVTFTMQKWESWRRWMTGSDPPAGLSALPFLLLHSASTVDSDRYLQTVWSYKQKRQEAASHWEYVEINGGSRWLERKKKSYCSTLCFFLSRFEKFDGFGLGGLWTTGSNSRLTSKWWANGWGRLGFLCGAWCTGCRY